MHSQDEEQLMFKKKKPTFAEWTLQNGVSVNNKPTTTTVGAIHESPAKATTSRESSNPAKTSDPFLEGFYSTDDKPETERKTYLRHRDTPSVAANAAVTPPLRSATVEPSAQKSQPIKLPYRPSVQGQSKITKIPYIPAQDGTLEITQYENNSANPYGSPVKIVGDNVTKKDYDDFWNAFHEERTGEKLNWAANQMQTQPQKQIAPQNRRSQNMMQWAMRERENLTPPQNTELTSELRDIEAAEKGDSNSEWFKRLESAWSSGDLDAYEAVEREMKAQKDRINYILKNRERTYDDNFFGQFGANYRAGRMSQDEALAWNEYYKNPTKENRAYAESISDTLGYFRQNNAATLADDAALPWLSQSLAGNLPQMIDQTKAGLAGAAGTGLTAGFIATASGNPFVAGTAALKGAQAGYSIATAKQAYDVVRGATFKKLIERGMDEEVARAAANDEAVLSSLIEMTDSGMDVGTAVDILINPSSAGVKGVLGILGKAGLNIAGEALEESLQEGISIANENRDGSGIFDLAKGAAMTYGDALSRDGEARRRILEAAEEGAKLATMTAAPAIIGGEGYKVDAASAQYSYPRNKKDGTIKGYLDSADDPIKAMGKLSKSIAKTSPIKIPKGTKPIIQIKNDYYQIKYPWTDSDGYNMEPRWHTRTPTAPLEQRDNWVVEREIKGIGYGPNARPNVHQVCVGEGKWITKDEWQKAATANRLGYATEQQKEWLKHGHRKA